MAQQRSSSRVVAIMWIVAAVLAWSAVAITYFGGGGVNWTVAAGGLFCAVMGIGSWMRAKANVAPGAGGPRVPPAT